MKLRSTVQLTLSFDHRVIDGDVDGRALRDIGSILTRPAYELMLGGAQVVPCCSHLMGMRPRSPVVLFQ